MGRDKRHREDDDARPARRQGKLRRRQDQDQYDELVDRYGTSVFSGDMRRDRRSR